MIKLHKYTRNIQYIKILSVYSLKLHTICKIKLAAIIFQKLIFKTECTHLIIVYIIILVNDRLPLF